MALIPKNDKYFEDFDRHIAVVRKMAHTLKAAVEQPMIPQDLWPSMKTLEHEADEIVRTILSRLERSFITPIEREDIHLLAVTIDDMADTLDAAANRMDVFDIREPNPDLRDIVRALDEMAEELCTAIQALKTMKPSTIRDATGKVDLLEERVDGLFRNALKQLFQRRPEAYDLVRWKEVYDLLEMAADHGRHIARAVNHIVVRHA
jgi:uncharacterized protein Yka (UPF0111/DUF47 family)